MYDYYLFSLQVRFNGMTGLVSFDKEGFRKDYSLDIMQLSFNNGPRKVNKIHCVLITAHIP